MLSDESGCRFRFRIWNQLEQISDIDSNINLQQRRLLHRLDIRLDPDNRRTRRRTHLNAEPYLSFPDSTSQSSKMARKMPARDVIVKLIVGAGQASPSPPVGPALGSKGVKSMDFCKV